MNRHAIARSRWKLGVLLAKKLVLTQNLKDNSGSYELTGDLVIYSGGFVRVCHFEAIQDKWQEMTVSG